MKKPFLRALGAVVYIVLIVFLMQGLNSFSGGQDKEILSPILFLSLFTLSVAVMGFLFFYDPICLVIENQKREAALFFGKTLGFFACFVVIFLIILFLFIR